MTEDVDHVKLYLLRFPDSIGIEPKAFSLASFSPPTTDHHSSTKSLNFSAYNTAVNTIRYRKAPGDPSAIQSNARILRWSDGSLTLQLASNPLEQHLLTAKALAAPQIDPKIPTPTSRKTNNPSANKTSTDAAIDAHEYLAAPHEHLGILRHTNHFTAALTIQSSDQDDEALVRLRANQAKAKAAHKGPDDGLAVVNITEDPELAKKRAELAEKEKNKLQRRLQIQRERESNRANNVLRRSGLGGRGMGAGLTIGGLEDDGGTRTGRSQTGKRGPKRPRRPNSEYSEDEDMYGRAGRTREDEYDEDDGFLVGSDEEIEEDGAASDEEEEIDIDAEGEDDDDVPAAAELSKEIVNGTSGAGGGGGGRLQRRRIIDDEDE